MPRLVELRLECFHFRHDDGSDAVNFEEERRRRLAMGYARHPCLQQVHLVHCRNPEIIFAALALPGALPCVRDLAVSVPDRPNPGIILDKLIPVMSNRDPHAPILTLHLEMMGVRLRSSPDHMVKIHRLLMLPMIKISWWSDNGNFDFNHFTETIITDQWSLDWVLGGCHNSLDSQGDFMVFGATAPSSDLGWGWVPDQSPTRFEVLEPVPSTVQ
ncbi:hypothetical protein JAAARDRAFT_200315 [Jaapia argillacea MUCL 33604]|uniref:Uncharacterized protein n=1 Tax=Jaapia argillacea MUCL 33604 TaxID=933084 RepID=A0A067P589_9AGAM|nr:hypothetical protein JAAARDRAFT_200315 [Jaapia argillacea MUCL 33604]